MFYENNKNAKQVWKAMTNDLLANYSANVMNELNEFKLNYGKDGKLWKYRYRFFRNFLTLNFPKVRFPFQQEENFVKILGRDKNE